MAHYNADAEKLIRLYEKYRSQLFRLANDILHQHADAEDAVQETFLRISKHLHKIDEEDESRTGAYLAVVCRHVAVNMYNARKKTVPDEGIYDKVETGQEPVGDSLSILLDRENRREFANNIKKLDVKYQSPFLLRYVQDFSYEEVSRVLSIEQATARKRVERAREKLIALYRRERTV